MERGAGILLHITSLPSGDFGSACQFIDFLHDAGIRYWQVLAFGPTGHGDSPYSPLSVFALEPKFTKNIKTYEKPEVDAFVKKHKFWVEPYAVYTALKEEYGQKDWRLWDKGFHTFESPAVKDFAAKNQNRISKIIQIQMNLFEQWLEIKKYANERGVKIIGDVPIYPAMDSADVWANRRQFQFNVNTPIAVAGVGPDYFNEDGQLWGNPLYDFKQMAADKYKWWLARIKHMHGLYDIMRIDHFRAFDTYYKIPYGSVSAKNGEWVKGPGLKFFTALTKAIPDVQIILEDLGEITQSVRNLRDKTGFPGMRVMQFGFDGKPYNEHLPINYISNCVAYIGTHDNDTFMGFLKSLNAKQRATVDDYLNSPNIVLKDVTRLAIENILQSPADIAVITMQDFLFQDTKSRMNIPGNALGNWKYKINTVDLSPEISYYIKLLVERSRR